MAEARTVREGSLWWVRASGSGRDWATASAPTSGLFGYVQSMTITSAETYQLISERGTPNHWKKIGEDAVQFTVSFHWTGILPSAISGSGASVPLFHLEHKAVAPENGNTGVYHQLHGVVFPNRQFTEGAPNSYQFQGQALNVNGPTGSGYIN
jgi:hypothetical protein